jgi:hypothetical protein
MVVDRVEILQVMADKSSELAVRMMENIDNWQSGWW